MPKFGIAATNQAPADPRVGSFIRHGVEDTSGEIGIRNMTNLMQGSAQLGTNLYKQNEKDTLSEGVQSEIGKYMDVNHGDAQQLPGELSTLEDYKKSLFTNPDVTKEDLVTVEGALSEKYASLRKALDQGAMSPAEFSDRVLTHLRESANKNPGLTQELQGEAQRTLELSGISGVLKADELAAKNKQANADEAWKDMKARMKEFNISYESDQMRNNIPKIQQELFAAEADKRAYDGVTRGEAYRKLGAEQQARVFIENTGSIATGGVMALRKSAETIFDPDAPGSYAQKKLSFQNKIEEMKNVWEESAPVSSRTDPIITEARTAYFRSLDAIKTSIDSFSSGEDALKAMKNASDVQEYTHKKDLGGEFDLPRLDLITKMATALPGGFTKGAGMEFTGKLIQKLTGSPNAGSVILKSSLPKNSNDTRLTDTVVSAAKVGRDTGSFSGLSKVLGNINAVASNPEIDVNTRNQTLYSVIRTISKEDLKGMDTSGIGAVKNSIGLMLHDKEQGLGQMVRLFQQGKTQMDILSDGRLTFSGDNADKFTNKFGVKINTALQAYANANNMTTKDASKTFYKEYLSPYLGGE